MFFKTLAVAALAACVAGGAAAASLSGVIRDFTDAHPDFEGAIGELQQGQIESTLGPDGLPVWRGPAKPGFTTKDNFDQWYRDVDGVNLSTSFELPLTDLGGDLLGFSSRSFFPIDDQLFGNQGRSHNHHFTLHLEGLATFDEGDSFSFTGDDDLWVFVDGKLALDIGGVHSPVSRSFDSDNLIALGLTPGESYALDIFFAERHTTQSNFKIETDLAIAPAPVPLPAAAPMLLAGLAGLGWMSRRRKA